jgi:hypothetical protein
MIINLTRVSIPNSQEKKMAANQGRDTAYGLSQSLIGLSTTPIISARNPTANDKAQIGQIWVNRTTGIVFFLSRIAANSYTWYAAAAAAAAYTAAGLVTAGTGLVATTGAGTPSTRGLHVAADGASITGLVTIAGNTDITGTFAVTGVTTQTGAFNVTGAITATTTITAGTGLRATTGGLTVTAGGATITAGDVSIVAGNLGLAAGDIATTVGDITSGGLLDAVTTVTAGTGITATTGNITATLGNIVCTAGDIINTLGNITCTAGDIINVLGDIVATEGNITATLGDIEATEGDIIAAEGDVIISTATYGITLPGPVRIITGAGAPANALAVEIGDMYIRTDAAAAVERIYIATAVNTWTNVTCAA